MAELTRKEIQEIEENVRKHHKTSKLSPEKQNKLIEQLKKKQLKRNEKAERHIVKKTEHLAKKNEKRKQHSIKKFGQQSAIHEEFNPHLYKNGVFSPPEKGFFKEAPEWYENIPNMTADQLELAKLLTNTVKEQIPDFINRLKQPAATGMSSQLEEMFGHMANPVLQNYINPSRGQNAQVLFPSQLANQDLSNILGQLATSGITSGLQSLPKAYEYAQEYGPQAYEYVKEGVPKVYNYLGKNLGDLTSGIQNYADVGFKDIRNPQTYGESIQQVLGAFMQPVVHPLNFISGAKEIGSNIFNNLFNRRGQ